MKTTSNTKEVSQTSTLKDPRITQDNWINYKDLIIEHLKGCTTPKEFLRELRASATIMYSGINGVSGIESIHVAVSEHFPGPSIGDVRDTPIIESDETRLEDM